MYKSLDALIKKGKRAYIIILGKSKLSPNILHEQSNKEYHEKYANTGKPW